MILYLYFQSKEKNIETFVLNFGMKLKLHSSIDVYILDLIKK